MLIYLVRHGRASDHANSDFERELTEQGVSQTRSIVNKLRARNPRLQSGLVSPYRRACQTAAEFARGLPGLEFTESDLLIPETDPRQLLQALEEAGDGDRILVGHNPLLSRLLSLLVDGAVADTRHLDTSTLACLAVPVVAPGCAELRYTLEP